MGMMTDEAINGYKEYTKKVVGFAQYKIGSKYYKTDISNVATLSDGRVAIDFIIDHTVPGDVVITEVQLYNKSGQLWLSKAEKLTRRNVQEGILYRVTFMIREG